MNSVIAGNKTYKPLIFKDNKVFVGDTELVDGQVIISFNSWFYGERLEFIYTLFLYNDKYQIYLSDNNIPERIGTLFAIKE